MNIRRARPDDIDAIRCLNSKIFVNNAEYDNDMISEFAQTQAGKKYFQEAIIRQDGCFFVVEEDGVLVGYTNGGHKDIPYRQSRYFEIENLGIVPEMAGKGLGKALLDTITTWAKEHGYQKIYLESYIKNNHAIDFYRKNGYHDIDISLEKNI